MATQRESAVKTYGNGEVIVQQGAQDDCMYMVRSGRVELVRIEGQKEFCLSELGPGSFFGEIVLFEKSGYPMAVRALSDVAVEPIDRDEFMRRVRENPAWALSVIEQLAHRARKSDEMLVQIADVKASIAYF